MAAAEAANALVSVVKKTSNNRKKKQRRIEREKERKKERRDGLVGAMLVSCHSLVGRATT